MSAPDDDKRVLLSMADARELASFIASSGSTLSRRVARITTHLRCDEGVDLGAAERGKRAPSPLPIIDLLPVTRSPGRTAIYLHDEYDRTAQPWITCGPVSLWTTGQCTEIGASLLNATDFEHDSAWAFRFRAIGVAWDGSVHNGATRFTGHIHPSDGEALRIPTGPLDEWYAALDFCEEEPCQGAADKHRLVPENYYAGPPPSPANAWLMGRRFTVHIYPCE